jgi:hypothetical protein
MQPRPAMDGPVGCRAGFRPGGVRLRRRLCHVTAQERAQLHGHQLGRCEWAPLLAPIADLNNFQQAPHAAVIQDGMLSFSMRLSVAYKDFAGFLETSVGPITVRTGRTLVLDRLRRNI